MAVGAQRPSVDEGLRQRVDDLVLRQAQHRCDHGGRGHPDQQHVIETDAVEAVREREHALDLVRLDHRRQHVAHRQRRPPRGDGRARQPVGSGQDSAQVVGRVAPLGGEPGVVEVEPPDHRADVECRGHRIELERRTRDARAVGHDRARHDRSQKLGAGRIRERLEAAAQRVEEAQPGRLVGGLARDPERRRVAGDVDQDLVGRGSGGAAALRGQGRLDARNGAGGRASPVRPAATRRRRALPRAPSA